MPINNLKVDIGKNNIITNMLSLFETKLILILKVIKSRVIFTEIAFSDPSPLMFLKSGL